jgi:hypothetical protein
MLLAAMLLLVSTPQSGDTAKAAANPPAAISSASNDSVSSDPAMSAPDPKVKTDAELEADNESASGSVSSNASAASVEPGSAPITSVRPATSWLSENPEASKKWWYGLAAAGSGAAVFDAWSTRRVITGGYGVEENPTLRPFAHSDALYAATQVSPLVMDLVGRWMMVSRFRMARRLWWLPQAAGSGVSVAAGVHNLRLTQ